MNSDFAAPPFDGMALLRLCFVLEGAGLALVAVWRPKASVPPLDAEPTLAAAPATPPDLGHRAAMWALLAVTVLGAVLRAYRLDAGLWIDEISPVVDYGPLSPVQVLSTYLGANNHLMNTLLVNESVSFLGRHAWAIRLPAALFGVATVPALYWVCRQALSRRVSLTAAALLAVSYHHVFFSQNARGYSGYLFFSVIACGLLCVAMRTRRTRDWALYAMVAILDIAALLNGAFVLAAHGLIALWGALGDWRRSGATRLLRQVVVTLAVAGLLVVHLYSLVIPQALVVMKGTYKMESAGFSSPFSAEFLRDLVGGLSPAIAVGASVALPILAVALAIGIGRVWARNRTLTAALILPSVLLAIFVIAEHLVVTPRLFIFGLIPVFVFFAAGLEWSAYAAARLWDERFGHATYAWAAGAATALCLASLAFYYANPKQDYAGAVDYVRSVRQPDDVLIITYLAKYGYRYYAEERGVALDSKTYFVRDEALFDRIVADHPGRRIWVVNTFERALRIDYPRIDRALQSNWTVAKRFPGLIGDGTVLVYRSKAP